MSEFHISPRINFQLMFAEYAVHRREGEYPNILNVGCSDDPVGLGEHAVHLDIDDWTAYHKYFKQADAHNIPYDDKSFDTVICGDVLEHVVDPTRVALECCRVCIRSAVFTIFEEWRLPEDGLGQIEAGQKDCDQASQALGFADRFDYQCKHYPGMEPVDDDSIPHLAHINQFTDESIATLLEAIGAAGFDVQCWKSPECDHEGHMIHNWLVLVERPQ